MVFLIVNIALILIKRQDKDESNPGFRVPFWIPLLGVGITGVVIGFAEPSVLMTTAALAVAGAGLYGLRRVGG